MNDQKKPSGGVNPLVAGAVGVAVGADRHVLTDKKNRDKMRASVENVGKEADKARTQAADKIDDLKGQANDMAKKARTMTDKAQKELEK